VAVRCDVESGNAEFGLRVCVSIMDDRDGVSNWTATVEAMRVKGSPTGEDPALYFQVTDDAAAADLQARLRSGTRLSLGPMAESAARAPDYPSRWREFRLRFWALMAVWIGGFVLLAALLPIEGWAMLLPLLWMVGSLALCWSYMHWACPRCCKPFVHKHPLYFDPWFPRRCVHCGLRIGASGGEAGEPSAAPDGEP